MSTKREITTSIIKKIYSACSTIIAFVSSVFLWYWNVSPGWTEGYDGTTTLVVVGTLYVLTYWFFAKMYQALKIGIFRLTELTFSQFLAYGASDTLLFVESVMWFHGLEEINIFSYIYVFAIQMILIVGIIFVCNRIHARYDGPRKIMIVYGNQNYKNFVRKLLSKKYRYDIVASLSDQTDIDIIKETLKDCVSIYLYETSPEVKKQLVYHCKLVKKNIYITQSIEELLVRGFDVSHTFDTPFVRTKKIAVKWYYPLMKRIIDIVFSAVAIIVFSPVFLVVSILIKVYDGGPVLYKQNRLTKNRKEFEIYKFRSMVVNAEKNGAQLSTVNDNRITPIGRFIRATRIDEMPQLFNIFKGDMSIIGPRPERPEIEAEYVKELPEFVFRLEVPAGLSGYAQVFGKYNTNPSDKLKLDLLYINQRSLLLDFKLMLYTVKILFIPESTEGVEETVIDE